MTGNLRQNVVILVVVLSFFAFSFAAGGAESAPAAEAEMPQTSKKPAKPTPAKKTAKATPTPGKKTAAAKTAPSKKAPSKPEPTPKKSTTAKSKTTDKKTDKKTTAKSAAKDTAKDKNSKNKTTAKAKETPAKKAAAKSAQKPAEKRAADKKSASSKSARTDPKPAAKNPRPVTIAKKTPPSPAKTTSKQTASRQEPNTFTAARPAVKSVDKAPPADAPQIIVTDVSARIRSQAKPGAPELTQAKLGTIFQVAEKTPAWYRVNLSSPGSSARTMSGWISANSVNDLNSASREQLYRQIAERYYKPEGMDFATASELFEFLVRAVDHLGNTGSSSAEIELKKLLALRSALKAIPAGRANENPYRDFLKKHEGSVVYSEPAAEWMVRSNLFWELRRKQEKSPLADQIAWEAAQNPLPGECEGYVNCYLFYARMTSGEYLSLHPTGRKNAEALNDLTNILEPIAASLAENTIYTGPSDVTDRAEFNNLIAELRTIVSRLPLTEKEKPLQQLKKIAEGFR